MPTKTNIHQYTILSEKLFAFDNRAELIYIYMLGLGYSESLMRQWAAMLWTATEGRIPGQHQAATMGLTYTAFVGLRRQLAKAGLAKYKPGQGWVIFTTKSVVRACLKRERQIEAERAIRAACDTPQATRMTAKVMGTSEQLSFEKTLVAA